jgi:hypothetical protein
MITLKDMRLAHFHIIIIVLLLGCKEKAYLPCSDTVFWAAVRQAESGGNDKLIYEESDGNLSVGRYMLSISDGAVYGVDCKFNSMADLFDGAKQEKCKDRIASKLKADHPDDNYQRALGRYWGVLRGPDFTQDYRIKSWNNFVEAANRLGCRVY